MSEMAKANEFNAPTEWPHNSRAEATHNSGSEQVYQIGATDSNKEIKF
jgi:hypothetical protein